MPTRLTQNTLIPISALIFIGSIVFWVSMIYSKSNENASDIVDLRTDKKELSIKLDDMSARLYRIEAIMERIDSKLSDKK